MELSHPVVGYKLVQPPRNTVWQFLRTLTDQQSFHTTPQSHSEVHPQEEYAHTKTWIQMFLTALFTMARYALTDKWMSKMCYIHTVEYYLAIKRNEI